MKKTKQIRFVCLLLLCAMLTGMLQPAAADTGGSVKAVQLLKRMQNLTPITGTNLLVAQESKQFKWGLYDTDGNVVIPLEYESLSYMAYGYLNAGSVPEKTYDEWYSIPLDEINSHALIALDGTVLTDYAYGTFKAFSPLWTVGWVFEDGTKDDNDFSPDKIHYFRIARCDVFYREETEAGEASCRLVFSLTRDEYKDAKAHGEYLSIQNREKGVTVYDRYGNPVDVAVKDLKTSIYGIKNWALVNLITGEMLLDGCSAMSEIQLEDEMMLLAVRTDFQGVLWNALLTTKGEIIIPMWNVTISSVSKDYAILTSNVNGKKGLYSNSEKRMILPCAYDEIYENKNALDRFNCHGYICVNKDGADYLYEVETMKLLPVVELEEGVQLNRYGPTFYTTSKVEKTTKTRLFAPDGSEKTLYCSIKATRGSGYLLVAAFSGGSNVITWYGKSLLPQNYSNITVTDDDRFIIKTKMSGYELYKVIEQ